MRGDKMSKKKTETLHLINGNGQEMVKQLPRLLILGEFNPVALNYILENTGLRFTPTGGGYEAQPISSKQIVALFLTYNFKTRYFDNWNTKNTIMLKGDHHMGFDVESICFECVKHNHLNVSSLKLGDYLAC